MERLRELTRLGFPGEGQLAMGLRVGYGCATLMTHGNFAEHAPLIPARREAAVL